MLFLYLDYSDHCLDQHAGPDMSQVHIWVRSAWPDSKDGPDFSWLHWFRSNLQIWAKLSVWIHSPKWLTIQLGNPIQIRIQIGIPSWVWYSIWNSNPNGDKFGRVFDNNVFRSFGWNTAKCSDFQANWKLRTPQICDLKIDPSSEVSITAWNWPCYILRCR